ncbi:MAG TPA: transaldolase [Solirubrobacteraceae bacterium]|nr:transaldolase [Solirubrobacteraceae bacterium]
MAERPLAELSALGQSAWIDFVSRDALRDGTLADLISEHSIVGVTSNPTIFQEAMSKGDAYDEQLRELGDVAVEDAFWALAERDIAGALELFDAVWQRTDGRDGYVSLEVDPRLAYDTLGTYRSAMALHEKLDRRNLMVKIPATRPGLGAIEDVIAAGRSINVTLIFSLDRYAAVAESYIRGLQRLVASGGDPSRVASVASFFVSRIDTEADRRLEELGAPEDLRGRLAVANARLAYEHYRDVFAGRRWEELVAKGARPQRLLWASTSTKNPAYSDVLYVEELIGPDTVNTMPLKTVEAFEDHGVAEARLTDVGDARETLDRLAAAGLDYDDVTATLERDGVAKFADSFEEVLATLSEERAKLPA